MDLVSCCVNEGLGGYVERLSTVVYGCLDSVDGKTGVRADDEWGVGWRELNSGVEGLHAAEAICRVCL